MQTYLVSLYISLTLSFLFSFLFVCLSVSCVCVCIYQSKLLKQLIVCLIKRALFVRTENKTHTHTQEHSDTNAPTHTHKLSKNMAHVNKLSVYNRLMSSTRGREREREGNTHSKSRSQTGSTCAAATVARTPEGVGDWKRNRNTS